MGWLPLKFGITEYHYVSYIISLMVQYASVEKEGEWFMSHEDFVCRYLQLASPGDNTDTIRFLADVADTNKTRYAGPQTCPCTVRVHV
jgi:hypothetical protein